MKDRTWTSSETDLLAIRFLDWVHSYEASGLIPGALSFYSGDVSDDQRDALISVVKNLHDRDLVGGPKMLAGWAAFHAILTADGRRLVAERRERRTSRGARSVAARDALLDWLFESTSDVSGEAPEIETFAGTPHAHIEGDPFTEREIVTAAEYLKSEGYVTGIDAWDAVLVRPTVTPKGRRAVETGRYTAEPSQQGSSHNTLNFHGNNYGQAAAGHSVEQQQTVSFDSGHLRDLVAAVRDSLAGLDPSDVSGGEAYLTMIDANAHSDEPNRGVMEVAGRGLLNLGDKVSGSLVNASIRTLWTYLADRFGFSPGE
jgi:hypothetical protein